MSRVGTEWDNLKSQKLCDVDHTTPFWDGDSEFSLRLKVTSTLSAADDRMGGCLWGG